MARQKKPQDQLRIPEGRFIRDDGTVQLVQPELSDDRLRPGRVAYDETIHKGKVLCPYCDVKLAFNRGSGAICGNNLEGARPHLKKWPSTEKNIVEHDEDCILPLAQDQDDGGVEPDKTRGYRLHLNGDFPGRVSSTPLGKDLYERNAEGRIVVRDESLKLRERFSIASVGDLMKFMRRGEFARIQDSIVIREESVVDWKDFLIHDRKGENRFQNLTTRLLQGVSQPCLMELHVYQASESPVLAGSFQHERLGRVIPRVYLDSNDVQGAMDVRGIYMVLGVPRLSPRPDAQGNYFLNVSVTDPGQVTEGSLTQLAAKARTNAERREERQKNRVLSP